jgi:hypothetical protein
VPDSACRRLSAGSCAGAGPLRYSRSSRTMSGRALCKPKVALVAGECQGNILEEAERAPTREVADHLRVAERWVLHCHAEPLLNDPGVVVR